MIPFSNHRFTLLVFCFFLRLVSSVSAQNSPVCFQLFFPTMAAQPGDTVCVPLMVRDFELIVAMQFSTTWDTAALELLDLDYYVESDLPGVEAWNFFLNPSGKLAFSWDDLSGMGVSLPDSSVLFRLCFRVKSGASGSTLLKIDRTETPIYEVVQILPPDWHSVMMPFSHQVGGVTIGNAAPSDLAIESTCVTTAICNAPVGGISLVATGGPAPYSYHWSGPNNFSDSTSTISGVSGGMYSITVTDQTGAFVTGEFAINSTPVNIYSSVQTQKAFCNQPNGCAYLQVNGANPPFSFQWSSGNSQTAENCMLVPGNYTVSISDNQGCMKAFPFQILNQTDFNLSFTYQHIYNCTETGSIKALVVPPGDYQFLWSNGDTTAAIDSLQMAAYTVTVTSLGGCTEVGTINIVNYSTHYWNLELVPVCTTDGLLLEGNGSLALKFNPNTSSLDFPVTVAWSDGTTRLINEKPVNTSFLDTLAQIPSGHYAVTLTSNLGCEKATNNVLYCDPLPTVPSGFPSFYVNDEYLTPQYAVDSCTGVYARNFEGITSFAFSLSWQKYQAAFREIKNVNLPDFGQNNLTLEQDNGRLGISWESTLPVTLPSESLLFEVCFDALHSAPMANVNFGDLPNEPHLTDSLHQAIPFIGKSGYVLLGLFFPPGPSVCSFAALPLQCAFDGKSRVVLGSCDPDKSLWGDCRRKDSLGYFQYYGLLNSLLFAEAGIYQVYAQQAASSSDYFLVQIPESAPMTECVWPGDADNNNVVNHHDLLYLGLAFGKQGIARNNPSIEWVGQDAADWVETSDFRHVNFKNIDVNGDGTINSADTIALVENWGRVINPAQDNPFDAPLGNNFGNNHPMLTIQADTLEAGQVVALPVSLGSIDMPMDSIYGLAFSISYNPALVKDNVRFQPSSSWFGDSTEFLFLQKNFPLQGHLDIAITRTDGVPVSGWGNIGSMFIIIEDNIFGEPTPFGSPDTTLKTMVYFRGLSSVNAVEKAKAMDAPPVALYVHRAANSAVKNPSEWARSIQLNPNPATEMLYISSPELTLERVEIRDLTGRIVQTQVLGQSQASLSIGQLPSGTFIVSVFTEKGIAMKKLNVVH